jgi:hypothetical protein
MPPAPAAWRVCQPVWEGRGAAEQDVQTDPLLNQASDLVEMILARAGSQESTHRMTGTGKLAIPVAADVLMRGDQIVTADGIRATVLCIDARDPRVGRWAECVTDDGQALRFAATANLTVTLLTGP